MPITAVCWCVAAKLFSKASQSPTWVAPVLAPALTYILRFTPPARAQLIPWLSCQADVKEGKKGKKKTLVPVDLSYEHIQETKIVITFK